MQSLDRPSSLASSCLSLISFVQFFCVELCYFSLFYFSMFIILLCGRGLSLHLFCACVTSAARNYNFLLFHATVVCQCALLYFDALIYARVSAVLNGNFKLTLDVKMSTYFLRAFFCACRYLFGRFFTVVEN